MTRLVVGSAFRSSSPPQINRWAAQVRALLLAAPDDTHVRAVAVEGDSESEHTAVGLVDAAAAERIDFTLIRHHHGGPRWGSVESPERMRALSGVGNAILDAVRPDDDYLFYVESDLIWEPETVLGLLGIFRAYNYPKSSIDSLSPLVFAGEHFYDVWATRGLDGARFSPLPPYHSSLADRARMSHPPFTDINEVSSVGSAILMRSALARDPRVRMSTNALVEWSSLARANGYRLFVAPDLRVEHPA